MTYRERITSNVVKSARHFFPAFWKIFHKVYHHFTVFCRFKVLTLLLSKGKITPDHINLLKSWKHSGFQVFCGFRIHPRKKEAMENLARYIIWASFSQERMSYLPEESQIIYRSKDNRQEKIFDALDWLAALTSHIPDQREQMVRYYGFYSYVFWGLRQKENEDCKVLHSGA